MLVTMLYVVFITIIYYIRLENTTIFNCLCLDIDRFIDSWSTLEIK